MIKLVLTIALTLAFFLDLRVGYTGLTPIYDHLLFHFSHANIFHLLCNLLALYAIKGKLYIIEAFILATLVSFIPTNELITQPTLGLSGVLFVIVGIRWGYYFYSMVDKKITEIDTKLFMKNIRNFSLYVVLPLIITIFIPNINWCLHLYSLSIGILYSGILYGNNKR